MNLPVAQSLPAYLTSLAQNTSLNASAVAGISTGGWPRISIKAARFRLCSPQAEEIVVPHLHLDVIIVDVNPHGVSKRFYDKKWDPTQEGEAPVCYSDNGVGPSNRSTKPQAKTCASCPHNVWGSKISEATGKQIKACSDLKKIAVLIADNTAGPVFELDIPADSMGAFATYVNALTKHGVPLPTVVTRLTFDSNASYPKLVFNPAFQESGQLPYITQEQMADVTDVLDTEEVASCTGKNDVPIDPQRVVAAATTLIAAAVSSSPLPPITHAAMPAFPQADAAPTGTPEVPALAGTPSAAPAAKRTRKAKPPEIGVAHTTAGHAETVPALLRNNPAAQHIATQAANNTAPLAPAGVTNSSLDDMIAAAMRT